MKLLDILFGKNVGRNLPHREIIACEKIYRNANTDIPYKEWLNIWNKIAELLNINPGKIRPSDRFGVELYEVDGLILSHHNLDDLSEWVLDYNDEGMIDLNDIEDLEKIVEVLSVKKH